MQHLQRQAAHALGRTAAAPDGGARRAPATRSPSATTRTELWTGTCTGDDRTGLRITWEPPTPRRQHDRQLTADDPANATVVQTAEQAVAAQAQPAVCDYEQQRNAVVARNQAFLGQLSLPAGTGFGSAWTQAHHEALREDVQDPRDLPLTAGNRNAHAYP